MWLATEKSQPQPRAGQRRVHVVGLAVRHPAKAELIHHGRRNDAGPGQFAFANARGRIAVAADGASGGHHAAGLNAVGRGPVHVVQAGAERVAIGKMIVMSSEAEIGGDRARQRSEEARQQAVDGGALCGRSRCSRSTVWFACVHHAGFNDPEVIGKSRFVRSVFKK